MTKKCAICTPSHNFVGLYLRNEGIYRQSEKLVKQQYIRHMFSQYAERRSTNGWDRFGSLGHPSKFQRVSRLGSVRRLLQRRRSPQANHTLHDVWPSPGLVHYTYIFGGWAAITLGIGPH